MIELFIAVVHVSRRFQSSECTTRFEYFLGLMFNWHLPPNAGGTRRLENVVVRFLKDSSVSEDAVNGLKFCARLNIIYWCATCGMFVDGSSEE